MTDHRPLRIDEMGVSQFDVIENAVPIRGLKTGPEMEIFIQFDLPLSIPKGNHWYFGLNIFQTPTTVNASTQIYFKVFDDYQIEVGIDRRNSGTRGSVELEKGPLRLKSSETQLSLRVFIDHSVVEAYFQEGRAIISSRVYVNELDNDISILTNGVNSVRVLKFSTWRMKSIWIDGLVEEAKMKGLVESLAP
jgi:sucrose-6-phosphate hydrolase SacC (GH32 family)